MSPNPNNLNILWNEYEVVIQGSNSEKAFRTLERGKFKEDYLKRKVIWDLVSSLVLEVQSCNTVIKIIYYVHGNVSVTEIITNIGRYRNSNKLHYILLINRAKTI